MLFETRDDLIRHYLTSSMVGAELGVFAGQFSEVLLSIQPTKLYLVDLFDGVVGSGDRNGENMVYIRMDECMNYLSEKYSGNHRVQIVKSSTSDFLKTIPDDSLDFVYIDADHSYEGVKTDIDLSINKVKSGGYIMGHDYVSPRFEGVVRAVDEFCQKTGLSIESLSRCGCPTYCIRVPHKDASHD